MSEYFKYGSLMVCSLVSVFMSFFKEKEIKSTPTVDVTLKTLLRFKHYFFLCNLLTVGFQSFLFGTKINELTFETCLSRIICQKEET